MNNILKLLLLFFFLLSSTCFAEVKEITSEGTYNMGDGETPTVAESRALLQAKRIAVEQAGTYIESYSKVINLQLTHDEINVLASGIMEVTILDKKRTLVGDGVNFWVKIKAKVSTVVEMEADFRTKSGEVRNCLVSGELIEVEGQPHILGIIRDITERKKAEEEIRIINEELLAINRIIIAITGVSNLKEILEKVLDEALSVTGLEGGTFCMVTPDETLNLAVHRETSEATILDLTTNQIKIGECLCGECARGQKPLILWDREAVLKFATREATRGEDIRFHAAFPMSIGGKCLGVLCVFTKTDNKPEERRLKLLETVTSQIALAVQNASLFEETLRNAAILEDRVKERTAELEKKISEIERLNKLFIGRELRMIELKKRIKELEGR